MNKNTYISLLIILILFTLSDCKNSSNSLDLNNFAVKDTAKIIKFKISDTEKNSIVISRNNNLNIWKIEGSDYLANQSSVDLLMETFYRVRVKQDVPNATFNTVINRLSVRHKKVEIFFNNDSPFKTWYIGSPTQDHMGTYMLLQNKNQKSSKPYITYKPGMYGSLDVRFFTDWKGWRSPKIFNYSNPKKIKKIEVYFNEKPNETYTISYINDTIKLFDINNKTLSKYDTIQVKHYLSHFNNISYNKIIFEKQQFLDSVFKNKPHYSFILTDISNHKINVDFWKIKNENSSTGWDVEYGYIRINKKNELLRAQYFNWEILFKPLSFYTNRYY